MADLLNQTVQRIEGANPEALAAAEERQQQLTKPPGSLGVLERLGIQLAGITGRVRRRSPTMQSSVFSPLTTGSAPRVSPHGPRKSQCRCWRTWRTAVQPSMSCAARRGSHRC